MILSKRAYLLQFVISYLVVILSWWRCKQDKESEDGVREHTISYVTERTHILDTVLRRIPATRATKHNDADMPREHQY